MKYFCTAGRGTERFLAEEIQKKNFCVGNQVICIDGKVFFETNEEISNFLQLKTAERLFALIGYKPYFTMKKKEGFKYLQETIQQAPQWRDAIQMWETVNKTRAENTDKESQQKSERRIFSGEKRKCTAVTGNIMHKTPKLSHVKTSGNIYTQLDTEEDKHSNHSVETNSIITSNMAENTTINDAAKNNEVDTNKHITTYSFRISLKCSGTYSKYYDPQQLSKAIASTVCQYFQWTVDLRNPDLEIFVQLTDAHLLIGIPLCKQPLSLRSYIKTIGLRSTISYIMADIADIKNGDLVLDPMCGVGTILLEAAFSWPGAKYYACDINPETISKACDNVKFSKNESQIDLLNCDARCLPLRITFDKIICDLPFGIQHSKGEDITILYSQLMTSFASHLKCNGRTVLLTNRKHRCLLKTLAEEVNMKCTAEYHFKLGWTDSTLLMFLKQS